MLADSRMSKTSFGPGVIVTSKFLNGAQKIYFDGADLDWHYSPINANDIQRGSVAGIDNVYVTLDTNQVYGASPVVGRKSFMSLVDFGGEYSIADPTAAPKSFATRKKFNIGGESQSFTLRFANLDDEDLITKEVLSSQISESYAIDEGTF